VSTPQHGAPDSAEGHAQGGAEHLVKMANDIGHFFRSETNREEAIAGIANHIAKFWTKRMREKLAAHQAAHGDQGLEELPLAALARLMAAKGAAGGHTA
jgi:formate dehydrogenase subunit delta